MLRKTISIIFGFSILVLLAIVFGQSSDGDDYLSPWDSLTAEEIVAAADAVKEEYDDDIMFLRMSLKRLPKEITLGWKANEVVPRAAEVILRHERKNYLVHYDFVHDELSSAQIIKDGQPMLSPDGEILPAVTFVNEAKEVQEALAKRGVEPDNGLCLPRTIGRYFAAQADIENDRIVRLDCFNIRGQSGLQILPSTAAFARPIEGIAILFNIDTNEIISITDSFEETEFPPHDIKAIEYHDGAMDTRAPLKPIEVSRPEGVNFTIRGSAIEWQGWQFHLRFDARQGTILNNVGYQTDDKFRPVAYEIAMAEMFVPYHDSDPNWYYRAYFDMGEYGFGNLAIELKNGDCPAHALYQDVTLHSADGVPHIANNRICIFEHDPAFPIWRHHESIFDGTPVENHHTRRATELVVRMVATIGNYDYFQDYVFGQDGRLRIRLISTGIDAAKGVFSKTLKDAMAAQETEYGVLIAPHRLGVNHDHYFSYRIDLDIDGAENDFTMHKLVNVENDTKSPRRSLWKVESVQPASEQQAQVKMRADKPALLVFSNAEKKNAMGYPTAYQIIMQNVKPITTYIDETYARAAFIQNNLWVTRNKDDEIFAAGLPTNQSIGGLGLPEYIANDESILATDIVAWATIGFHHVHMAEDWPVMPAKVDEIILKPRNFFDKNPAIDLTPTQ